MLQSRSRCRTNARVFADAHSRGAANRRLHLVLYKVGRKIAAVILSRIRGGHTVCTEKRIPVFGDRVSFQALKSQAGRNRALGCILRIIGLIHGRHNTLRSRRFQKFGVHAICNFGGGVLHVGSPTRLHERARV